MAGALESTCRPLKRRWGERAFEGSMMRMLSTWPVLALSAGALVAGCGSSTSTSSSQTSSTSARSTPAVARRDGSTSARSNPAVARRGGSTSAPSSPAAARTRTAARPSGTNPSSARAPLTTGTTLARAPSSPATSTPGPAATGSGGGAAPSGAGSSATELQAVASCRQIIQAQPTISAETKAKLEAICPRAVGSSPTAFPQADQEICVKLIDDTTSPGPAREQALAACKQVK